MHNTPHTEESKRKMSEAKIGKHYSPATEFQNGFTPWNKGKHYHLSDEHRRNISKGLIGNKYRVGTHHSQEHIERLRLRMIGNTHGLGMRPNATSFKKGDSVGDKNVNWKGGVTKVHLSARHSLDGRTWQRSVKRRDGYRCRKCLVRGHHKVTAHHIQNFSEHVALRFDMNNGITLCRPCHRAFHKQYGVRNNTTEQLEEFLQFSLCKSDNQLEFSTTIKEE